MQHVLLVLQLSPRDLAWNRRIEFVDVLVVQLARGSNPVDVQLLRDDLEEVLDGVDVLRVVPRYHPTFLDNEPGERCLVCGDLCTHEETRMGGSIFDSCFKVLAADVIPVPGVSTLSANDIITREWVLRTR